MEIDWITFVAAVLALWVPASLLYPAAGREALAEQHGERIRIGAFFSTWQHWVDAARGFLGAWFLVHVALSYTTVEQDFSGFFQMLGLVALILAVAVGLQTIQYRKAIYCTAPIAFLLGLTFALSDWQAALFAGIFSFIVWTVSNAELKFVVMAGLLAIVGYFLMGRDVYLILNCALIILPILLTYIAGKTFVIYTRSLIQ